MDFTVYANINLFFFLLLSTLILLINTPKKDTNIDRIREQDSESSEKKLTVFDSNVHLSILRNDNMLHLGLQNLRT